MTKRTPIVFITNLGAHDYRPAEEFGELRFLTKGKIKRYSTNTIYRDLIDGMQDAEREDYLLISSLSILNSIAAAIIARKFGVVNFLLYYEGKYILRSVNIDALLETDGGEKSELLNSDLPDLG